jgi:hypothetical protein
MQILSLPPASRRGYECSELEALRPAADAIPPASQGKRATGKYRLNLLEQPTASERESAPSACNNGRADRNGTLVHALPG